LTVVADSINVRVGKSQICAGWQRSFRARARGRHIQVATALRQRFARNRVPPELHAGAIMEPRLKDARGSAPGGMARPRLIQNLHRVVAARGYSNGNGCPPHAVDGVQPAALRQWGKWQRIACQDGRRENAPASTRNHAVRRLSPVRVCTELHSEGGRYPH